LELLLCTNPSGRTAAEAEGSLSPERRWHLLNNLCPLNAPGAC